MYICNLYFELFTAVCTTLMYLKFKFRTLYTVQSCMTYNVYVSMQMSKSVWENVSCCI